MPLAKRGYDQTAHHQPTKVAGMAEARGADRAVMISSLTHPYDVTAARYPRMTAAMKRQGILSQGEAAAAVHSLSQGKEEYGEAVQHYGGVRRLAEDAFRNRNLGRR